MREDDIANTLALEREFAGWDNLVKVTGRVPIKLLWIVVDVSFLVRSALVVVLHLIIVLWVSHILHFVLSFSSVLDLVMAREQVFVFVGHLFLRFEVLCFQQGFTIDFCRLGVVCVKRVQLTIGLNG